jgi:hypothetical protein
MYGNNASTMLPTTETMSLPAPIRRNQNHRVASRDARLPFATPDTQLLRDRGSQALVTLTGSDSKPRRTLL